MTIQEYNGWTNRETWATALWIDNDEGMQETARDYTLTAINEHSSAEDCTALSCLADTLENWIVEEVLTHENVAGNRDLWLMLTDIGSLYRVNWREIADSYLDETAEEGEGK